MAFTTRHIGSTFDKERYERIDQEANHQYQLLQMDSESPQEHLPEPLTPRRRAFKLRIRLPNVWRSMKKKMKSMVRRLSPRKRNRQTPPQTNHVDFEETRSDSGDVEIVEFPFELEEEKSIFPQIESFAVEEGKSIFAQVEAIGSDDEENVVVSHDEPYRYKHRLPCEEEKPTVEEGRVGRLVDGIAPQVTTSEELCTSPTSRRRELFMAPLIEDEELKTSASDEAHVLETKQYTPAEVSPLSSKGSSLKTKSSGSASSEGKLVNSKKDLMKLGGVPGKDEPAETDVASEAQRSGYGLLPHRVRSLLPCEEPQPHVQAGHVARLAELFSQRCDDGADL